MTSLASPQKVADMSAERSISGCAEADSKLEEFGSYRRIIKGTALIGGSSVANVLLAVIRAKILAVIVGPGGMGLAGLWSSFMATASVTASMGLGTAGVREVVSREGADRDTARRHLRLYAVMLALLCFCFIFAFRNFFSTTVLQGRIAPTTLGWLGLGAAVTVLGAAFTTELRGLHRIADVARIGVVAAVLGTALVVTALMVSGDKALLLYVLVPSITAACVGAWYLFRVAPITNLQALRRPALLQDWKGFASIGVPVMFAGIFSTVAALLLRLIIVQRAGIETLGFFVGAYVVAEQYLGFILQAMGTDYFPRLAAVFGHRQSAVELINRQTRLLFTLGTPVLFAMLGFAGLLLPLLYTAEFSAAVRMFQLFVLADFFKMLAWPMGFALLAQGHSIMFTAKEFGVLGVYLAIVWLIFAGDLTWVGYAYLMMRVLNVAVVYVVVGRTAGYHFSPWVLKHIIVFLLLGISVYWGYSEYPFVAGVTSAIISAVMAATGYREIRTMLRPATLERKS